MAKILINLLALHFHAPQPYIDHYQSLDYKRYGPDVMMSIPYLPHLENYSPFPPAQAIKMPERIIIEPRNFKA